MRIPAIPPKLPSFSQLSEDLFTRLVTAVNSPSHRGRYVHWDKLRHLPRPANMTAFSHEEWWFGLKIARQFILKPVPLEDTKGNSFMLGVPDPVPRMLHQMDRGGGGLVLLSDQTLNSSMRDEYVVRSLTEEAITSSQLEGAATTREVAKQMLRSGRSPRDIGERMILNNYRAMEAIREHRGEPLTPEMILDLHRILTRDTLEKNDAVGRFRNPDEHIRVEDVYGEVLHTPPRADLLPERIRLMCEFANGKTPGDFIHPVIRAIILHFWLAYDHPFVDGNGRCARALFYWSMLNSGYWLCEFISISHVVRKAPTKYGRAFLYTETDDNDLTYFVLYHLDILKRALEELHKYMDRKTRELRQTEQFIRLRDDLNHRQLSLLSHALRHTDALYTIREHQGSHRVTYQTARTDLFELAKKGYLQESKRGREYFFRSTADLAGHLAGK